ncbi:MAG: Nitroreductase family [Rubrobacteraceae bacterium]|jgi:nitroreductase|nr:Nitroreductase family [Rubrobacteraceae bacterium]
MSDVQIAKDRTSFLRGFSSHPIPREVLDDVLEVARWTGSASNRQLW